MGVSKDTESQIMTEFNLIDFQRFPFSFKQYYEPVNLDNLKNTPSKIDQIWASEFENLSGTKYICGVANAHIQKIADSCSCTGAYGLTVQTNHPLPNPLSQPLFNPLSQGHIINLNFNKNYLKKTYCNVEEFIKENPSPVLQKEFLHHQIKSTSYSFTADIVYRAIFEIVSPTFEHFIELEKELRHIENSAPIKRMNNFVAQDTYVKLIF